MSRPPLLVLDSHFLCHRAFHTSGGLTHRGVATGVIFGFLKSIAFLKDEFQTDRVAFCFEHPHLFRRDRFPDYKRHRHTARRTEQEIPSYKGLSIQIQELRQRYLPSIGFNNVFCFRGMESDDIMAALANVTEDNEETILVTSDADLLQCLRPNVTVYSPQSRTLHTEAGFVRLYGIQPRQWAVVKALAGCHSDEVPGIRGIGDKTALRFLRGELPKNSKAYQSVVSKEGKAVVRRNRPLVELPFVGCPVPKLVEDQVTKEKWLAVCDLLGMRSLAAKPPIATRRLVRLQQKELL